MGVYRGLLQRWVLMGEKTRIRISSGVHQHGFLTSTKYFILDFAITLRRCSVYVHFFLIRVFLCILLENRLTCLSVQKLHKRSLPAQNELGKCFMESLRESCFHRFSSSEGSYVRSAWSDRGGCWLSALLDKELGLWSTKRFSVLFVWSARANEGWRAEDKNSGNLALFEYHKWPNRSVDNKRSC